MQLAKFGDNLKEGLPRPTFHEDGLHAPMEADNIKDGLHKPTFHEDGLHASMEADDLKDGLHKPTFLEDGLQAVGKVHRQFQGWSSQVHLPRG